MPDDRESAASSDQVSSSWTWVGRPGSDPAVVPKEAFLAAPSQVLEGGGEFLPRTPRTDRCRLCGEVRQLTQEHIPARSAFNKGRFQNQSFEDWLEESRPGDPFDAQPRGPVHQGGIRASTLCADCNNFVGRKYVDEYKGWAIRAAKMLARLPPPRELDQKTEPQGVIVEFGDIRPGAFVRAVLGAMCSVSSGWDLAGRHPVIRRMILDGEAGELPPDLRLYLGFYAGPKSRLCGPQLAADRATGHWSWLIEVSHPTLTNLMRLAGTKEPDPGLLDITTWTTYSATTTATLEATFLVGFGWSPYPGDYRSSARMRFEGTRV